MSTAIENRVWSDIQQAVRKRLNAQSFDTWIRPIQFDGYDESGHILHLRAPNQVLRMGQFPTSQTPRRFAQKVNLASYHVDCTVMTNCRPRTADGVSIGYDGLASNRAGGSHKQSSSLFSLVGRGVRLLGP